MAKNKQGSGKHPGGRPTEYREEYARMAYVACTEGGFTDVKLAKLFGVAKQTIYNWKREHPEFLDSIIRGKDEFDVAKAEECLLKRVTGYRYTEVTRERNDQGQMVVSKKVGKHIPPDVKAITFFLINRSRDGRWRRIQSVEVTGKNGGPLEHRHSVDDPEVWKSLIESVTTNTSTGRLPNGRGDDYETQETSAEENDRGTPGE